MSKPNVQLLFSIHPGTMTHPEEVEQDSDAPNPDAGFKTLGMLTEDELDIGPDGSFTIYVGGPARKDRYLATEPVACSFGCRQMLLDWTTTPLRLSIRRLDQATNEKPDIAGAKKAVLSHLEDFVRFWATFPDVWLGGVKTNEVCPPAPRDGGWGYMAGVNFKLAYDEAAIITLHPGRFKYMGFQLTDPWLIGPDNGRRQSSLNLSQSMPNADGSYTYVISSVDPGVANWLDTCGMSEGFGIMRWQGFPDDVEIAELFHDFSIVKLSEIENFPEPARITSAERSQQLEERVASFFSRYSAV